MDYIYWTIAGLTLLYFIYKWATKDHDYFTKRQIIFEKPYPLIGNFSIKDLIQIKSITDGMQKQYNKFPNDKLVGLFGFRSPILLVKDPELIQKITIKDFDYFTDHQNLFGEGEDQLLLKVLTLLKGQKWKEMRSTLSPAFTGSKMRLMFELVNDCGKQITNYISQENKNTHELIIDVKDTFSKFTNDVIATCAFGIKVDSFENKDNEFFIMGKKIMNPNPWVGLMKFIFWRLAPKITKLFNISLFDKNAETFFKKIINETMDVREKQNIIRPDMINLLMQVKNGQLKHEDTDHIPETERIHNVKSKIQWTQNDFIAQCLVFFIGGFEPNSVALTFIAYELAANPDIQQKLIEEIDETYKVTEGNINYNIIQSMKYLEMVVSEGLRKWPPLVIIDRKCTKDYILKDSSGREILIEKGKQVMIPVYGLHFDPNYFENPDQFNPERFSESRIKSIIPGSYLPFGMGPRSCIASRFALMVIKIVLYHILREFTFEICDKTQNPMKMGRLTNIPESGVHLAIKNRQNA